MRELNSPQRLDSCAERTALPAPTDTFHLWVSPIFRSDILMLGTMLESAIIKNMFGASANAGRVPNSQLITNYLAVEATA